MLLWAVGFPLCALLHLYVAVCDVLLLCVFHLVGGVLCLIFLLIVRGAPPVRHDIYGTSLCVLCICARLKHS